MTFSCKSKFCSSCGSITNAITKAKKLYSKKTIEVKVKNLTELQKAIKAKPDIIILDNFSLKKIKETIKIKRGKIKLEVSGGITLNNINSLAKTGVDFVSVGAITKTVMPIEPSLVFDKL